MQNRTHPASVYALVVGLAAFGCGQSRGRSEPSSGGAGGQGGEAGAAGGSSLPLIEYDGLNGIARDPIVSDIFTADPSAHSFEGKIYVYTSHDLDTQTGYEMHDYHVFSSDDLVNWKDHGVVLDDADIPWAYHLYAPDCAYSEATGKYYLYFANGGSSIGVAVSDSPSGPFEDALGGPLIDSSTPGVEDVDWIFDPACFVDQDGQAYLYFGGGMPDTGDNARVIRLGQDMISLADDAATVIEAPDFFEASFMHQRDGKYYFSYSTTFAEHSATIDYLMSDHPMTGFEYTGTLLPNPKKNNNQNNHHSVVEYQGSWYVFYHDRTLAYRDGYSNYQRSVAFDRLSYNDDGTIVEAPAEMSEIHQLHALDAFATLDAETYADQRGIEVEFAEEDGQRTGVDVTDIHDGDWIGYSQVDFGNGASSFSARVASDSEAGGTIGLFLDGCDRFSNLPGELIGTCSVGPTGGWQIWEDIECDIEPTSGVHDLYLRFAGKGTDPLFNFDHFQFE